MLDIIFSVAAPSLSCLPNSKRCALAWFDVIRNRGPHGFVSKVQCEICSVHGYLAHACGSKIQHHHSCFAWALRPHAAVPLNAKAMALSANGFSQRPERGYSPAAQDSELLEVGMSRSAMAPQAEKD